MIHRFTFAFKRACDIQYASRSAPACNRCSGFDDITTVASGVTVSIAGKEINDGTLGFVKESLTRPWARTPLLH